MSPLTPTPSSASTVCDTHSRGMAVSGRPGNFQELAEMLPRLGWSKVLEEFLDEFYIEPVQEAIATPPPPTLADWMRAELAGIVEVLAEDWADSGITLPDWVTDPTYTLNTCFCEEACSCDLTDAERETLMARRMRTTPEPLRRHGVLVPCGTILRV